MNRWVEAQAGLFQGLKGKVATHWSAIEMALREPLNGTSRDWVDPSVPYLQLLRLRLALSDGLAGLISTYQNVDQWGLRFEENSPVDPASEGLSSIFRFRKTIGLPVGEIQDIAIKYSEGDIEEVKLVIEGNMVSLTAGEVEEQFDGSLMIRRMDESVLVQVNGNRPL